MKKNQVFPLLLFISWICCVTTVKGQQHLLLPVDFMIENGNFENTTVAVKKDGATLFTVPGKSFMKVKLQFNNDYILSFSKPGYITKSITVNTIVPPERLDQTFEPYKIGVKLFRQYEGVNIVVYNQPVARIYFNSSLDDFDYDVDYTKSILSILKKTEEELMVRAAEERATSSGSVFASNHEEDKEVVSDASSSGQMNEKSTEIDVPAAQQRRLSIAEPPLTVTAKNGGVPDAVENPPSPGVYSNEDPKKTGSVNTDADKQNGTIGNGDEEHKSMMEPVNEIERNSNTIGGDGMERNSISLISKSGDDLMQKNSSFNSDVEARDAGSLSTERTIYNKFVEVEKNRTITTFRITKGISIAEYRKVDYNWGGVFYFRGVNYAISRNVFHWATGEF